MIIRRTDAERKLGREGLETQATSKDYLCPVCLGPVVVVLNRGFECQSCQICFPVIDGIPIFAKSTASGCGTMAYSELEALAHHCQNEGWGKGIASFLAGKEPRAADAWARYFIPEARAAGRLLLPVNPRSKVLDLGCGIGPLSINFAHYADEVVAVDCGLTQLRLLRLRGEQAGRRNLRLVCAGDRQHLPFQTGTFDIVLLNGVLEWVSTKLEGDARRQQLALLAEAHRILKPDGEMYIGIENRFALAYLAGMDDEHTNLRFLRVLPRRIANVLCHVKTGQPYRIYTHSRVGYRKLLREAGFAVSRFYVPRPSYRNIREIIRDHRDTAFVDESLAEPRLGRMKRRLKALADPHFAHSYSIVAGKSSLSPNLVEGIVARLEDWLAVNGCQAPRLQQSPVRVGETSVALVSATDKRKKATLGFLLRIPLTPQAACGQRHNFQMLDMLASRLAPESWIKPLLPEPVVVLDCDGQPVFVHHLCPGFDLSGCYRPKERRTIFRLGLGFLLKLAGAPVECPKHSVATLNAWLRKREEHLYRTVPISRQDGLRALIDSTIAVLYDEPPLCVWTHGDFWPGNLLSTARRDHLTGIVDWEFADSEGMPLIDLLQLLLYTKGLALGRGFGYLLGERLAAGRFENDERPFIEQYCDELGISRCVIWPLAFMAWLDWVYRRSGVHGHLPSWYRNEIDSFLNAVHELPHAAL